MYKEKDIEKAIEELNILSHSMNMASFIMRDWLPNARSAEEATAFLELLAQHCSVVYDTKDINAINIVKEAYYANKSVEAYKRLDELGLV